LEGKEMVTKASVLRLVLLCLTCVDVTRSQHMNTPGISPFTNLGDNTVNSLSGGNLYVLPVVAAATYVLLTTDTDFYVHEYFSRNIASYETYTSAALLGGYIAPLAVGGGMYLWGKINGDSKTSAAGSCALQAITVAQLTVTVLKAVTGRPGPDPTKYPDMREASHIFQFGFLRGGLHYGWPSGHLATNTAWIVALMTFYNRSLPVHIGGAAAIAYLIFGVSAHEGATMHWFSDVIAGTVIGCAIGSTVGRSFRDVYERNEQATARSEPQISAVVHRSFSGIRITIPF
jgi:membrane-associated phospholipid phosphatase